jgi:hypothetical protein
VSTTDLDAIIAMLRMEATDLRIEMVKMRETARIDLARVTTNLTETQKRCTDLLSQVREYRQRGLMLPGWNCERCGCFNGEAKEEKLACRSCGASAPEGVSVEPPPRKKLISPEEGSEEQYKKAPTSDDPIAQTANGLWWFFSETWADMHGPYAEETDARVMFKRYCDEVIGSAKEAS